MARLTDGDSVATAESATPAAASRVRVINADDALYELIKEWLSTAGFGVACGEDGSGNSCDLVIVDVPFPKQAGAELLRRVSLVHPGTPVLALSSAFFPGVEHQGTRARSLGVAGALPKPVAQDVLLSAVNSLLRRVS